MKYKILMDKTMEGGLFPLRRYDEDIVIEPDELDEDGNEFYEVESDHDLTLAIDQCLGVISYEEIA